MYLGHDNRRDLIYSISKDVLSSIKSVDVLLDLGSRHGEGFGEIGRQFTKKYIMVEPSPKCFPFIQTVIDENKEHDITHIKGILGSVAAQEKMYVFESDNDQSGNLFSDRGNLYGQADIINVQVFPFEVIEHEIIDFAKINIEGGEYELIQQPFFRKINSFVMEVHNKHVPGKTYKDVIAALEDEYDLMSYGDLTYKYCFISGYKCQE